LSPVRLFDLMLGDNWRGPACQFVDIIDLDIKRNRYVVTDQFKMFVAQPFALFNSEP
jgi:hypothetical protein